MSQELQCCVDRPLPPASRYEAALHAVAENWLNAPRWHRMDNEPPLPPDRLALFTAKRWEPGRTLDVRFLDGIPEVQERVLTLAQQWTQHANLKIVRSDAEDAEIRISFQRGGSWSYIGTDCLSIPRDQATMNFGWLYPGVPSADYYVVLHEFGHALGYIHEHQSPANGIPWNREAVYHYYSGPPNYWNRAEIDHNLFAKYDRNQTNYTAWDKHSIMEYPIPEQLVTDPAFAVGWNRELSPTDQAFARRSYPFADSPTELIPAAWIAKLYRDVLGREASPPEITAQQTRPNRRAVATSILGSNESHKALVTSWYQKFLRRAPDAGGLAAHTATLDKGVHPDTVLVEFLLSSEYQPS